MKRKSERQIPSGIYRKVLAELQCVESRIKAIKTIIHNDDAMYLRSVRVETNEARAILEQIQTLMDDYLKNKEYREHRKELAHAVLHPE
jgi:hypothetical protein